MFSIITVLTVILVVLLAIFFAYQIRVSPARKGLLRNDNISNMDRVTPEDINTIITKNSEGKHNMEFGQKLTTGGEGLGSLDGIITFPPLHFLAEDKTEIILLPKNPHWLFAYWTVVEETIKEFESQFGNNSWNKTKPLLKIYNHSDDSLQEISVEYYTNNWYIAVNPENYYTVILGRKFPCGKFIELAVSKKIQAASANISTVIDKDWLPIEECWKVFKEYKKVGFSSEEFLHNK